VGEVSQETRCGFVALMGAPNAGKSTLLNTILGTKVAIVSPKIQTTRSRLLGITIEGNAQIAFVDTPGIFRPRRRLDRAMVRAAWKGAADADLIVVLVDAKRGVDDDTRTIMEGLRQTGRKAILALNKIDAVKRPSLLALAERLTAEGLFSDVFMISALTGDGVADLTRFLAGVVPSGPWLYPEDQITDAPLRFLAAEITREQLYLQLHEEIPYQLAVETESWVERPDGSVRIGQVIYVSRPNQKAIVLGKNGRRIKAISQAARLELVRLMDRPVHLFLFVKVSEAWDEDRERFVDLGLEFDT